MNAAPDTDQLADAEKIRAAILKASDPSIAAAAERERRITNSRMNRVEIGRYNALIATLEQNNAALMAFGDVAVEFAATDPVNLHWRELQEQIATLGRLARDQANHLERHRARAAAAERQRIIANETPDQRAVRLLTERVASLESEGADLKARVAELECDRQSTRPARPMPPMSGVPISMGDGLSPANQIARIR
jgi:hypothetical protein